LDNLKQKSYSWYSTLYSHKRWFDDFLDIFVRSRKGRQMAALKRRFFEVWKGKKEAATGQRSLGMGQMRCVSPQKFAINFAWRVGCHANNQTPGKLSK
jgi:hypothetical protein